MSTSGTQTLPDASALAQAPPGRRGRYWFLLLIVFLSGGALGASIASYVVHDRDTSMLRRPEQLPERLLEKLRRELTLSDDQADKLRPILERHHERFEAIRAQTRPQISAEMTKMEAEVATQLDEQQQADWHAWCEKRRSRFQPGGKR